MRKVNYEILSAPSHWNSVSHPIKFTYDFPTEEAAFYNHNSEGLLTILCGIFMDNDTLIKAGSIVYISSGIYKGYHTVNKFLSFDSVGGVNYQQRFQLNSPYLTAVPNSDIKFATPPVWTIYKGFLASEVSGNNYHPYSFVSDFKPEGNLDGELEFDVSGYVKSAMFPIQFRLSYGIRNAYELYMPFRIINSNYFESYYMALNSGITTDELNGNYVGTNRFLAENVFRTECADWVFCRIEGDKVVQYFNLPENPFTNSQNVFSNGFNSGFILTP